MQLQQIAERCQQGDREAFALLYTAMRQPLRTVCLSYVHDEAVADDLLHDAFLLVFFQIGKLKDTARTEAWMTMVMRRVSLLYLRKQRQQGQEHLTCCAATSSQSPSVENHAESSLAVEEILAAVDALPEGYRRVFQLFVLEGMSHQEIAALLNIEPHSSSSQLVHAKALLRRWLHSLALILLVVSLPLAVYLWFGKDKHQCLTEENGGSNGSPSYSSATGCGRGRPRSHVGADPVPARLDPVPAHNPQPDSLPQATAQASKQQHHLAESDSCMPTSETAPALEVAGWHRPLKHDASHWTLAVTYSGVANGSPLQLPYADAETNPVVYDSIAHHHRPLTVSLMLNRRLGTHWQVGAGLSYQRLSSDMLSGNTYVALSQHQVVQYIGLPVSVSWHYPLGRRFSTYLSASASVSLPLRSTLESVWLMGGQCYEPVTERLRPAVQWSVGTGIGLQYNLTPHVGFFAEPGLHYRFNGGSGDDVKTWNTEHPFGFSVPIGMRITF